MSSKKLTPEILAKLQGYGTASGVIKYIIEIEDVPKDFCPVFDIKLPTNGDYKKYRKELQENEGDTNDLIDKICEKHIIGWKNYYDTVKGEEVEFTKSEIKNLSQKVRSLIFVHISEITGVI